MSQLQKAALLSVSNKEGIIPFAEGLVALGLIILSTEGTAKALLSAGVPVTLVETHTGFTEMMDGRLKTLHPLVHGGILGREQDRNEMLKHKMYSIDVVAVNLYPFEATIAKPGCTFPDAIEKIDIGGPTMLRGAAKNHDRVTAICDPADYTKVLFEMQAHGGIVSQHTREVLAYKVFEHTAHYDSAIRDYLKLSLESERA